MSVEALRENLDASMLQLIDGETLMAGSYAQPQPIIENILLPGATLMHGPAKKGKSWFLLQMATAIDAGETFLACATHRRDVLYVGAEDDEARFRSRLERIGARGTVKFVTRTALERFGAALRASLGDTPPTVAIALEQLWQQAGRPSVVILDTQEVFEHHLGIAHGKPGDSVTRRDYLATSSYDGIALKHRIAIVLVGHWGEIKSIEKATLNPHECLNTTKARLAGVTTSLTLGPLPNQDAGESSRDMQLSIRSRDLPAGDQFLWVRQDADTGRYELIGAVRDVMVTQSQQQLVEALIAARKAHGTEHWTTAADLAEEFGVSVQAVKQMVGRVRRAAKARGREPVAGGYRLESKPNKGYRVV
ncbi:MAG: HTH domain-containing protein [Gammaproteobacteria bacterium]|nr:HTH domain-containing protein [Gammaproteobacteria bacterium]